MIEVIYDFLQVLSLILQGFLIFLLLGSFRRYFLLFFYCLTQLVASVAEVVISHQEGRNSALYSTVYWSDEVILDLLLFLVVIALAFQASAGNPAASAIRKLLGVVVVAALVLPFVLVDPPYFRFRWFNGTSQLLNFGGAIMNLALWTLLLGMNRRDPQLLLVSVGVGIAVTGAAISWGLRLFLSVGTYWIPNIFLIGTHLVGVLIWCWAFRPLPRTPREQDGPVSSRA
jgi:hypothetical protein